MFCKYSAENSEAINSFAVVGETNDGTCAENQGSYLFHYCLIGLNKKRHVSKTEYSIYKYSLIGAFLFSAVLCVILTRFTSLITIALYNGIGVVCALLLILVPAKKKLRKNDTLGGMNHE